MRLEFVPFLATLPAIAQFFIAAFSQTVLVGRPPTQHELKDYCNKIETIRPNLALLESVHVTGRLSDAAGAPLMKSRMELRRYISQRNQVTVRVTTTDEKGNFDLGIVEAEKYRLLASPNRIFRKPPKVECHAGKRCELNIALQINTTEQPDSACPIRRSRFV